MKKSKLKSWFKEHEDEIKLVGEVGCCYLVGVGFAWCTSSWLTKQQLNAGMQVLLNHGLMKFINPSTGLEVTVEEACEIAKKMEL